MTPMAAVLIRTINLFGWVLSWLVVIRSLLSFVMVGSGGGAWLDAVYQFVFRATEPFLAPLRRWLPTSGALDWSPLVLLLAIWAGVPLLDSLIGMLVRF